MNIKKKDIKCFYCKGTGQLVLDSEDKIKCWRCFGTGRIDKREFYGIGFSDSRYRTGKHPGWKNFVIMHKEL